MADIVDDQAPRSNGVSGGVIKVCSDLDGVVRVVQVYTRTSNVTRSVVKRVPLPST